MRNYMCAEYVKNIIYYRGGYFSVLAFIHLLCENKQVDVLENLSFDPTSCLRYK